MTDESKSTEQPAPADDSGKRAARADPEATAADKQAKRAERKESRKEASAKVKKGSDVVRSRIASVVWLVAVVCALFLAVGALLTALNAANKDNAIVSFVLDGGSLLDGPFEDLFQFKGEKAADKGILVNWGLAAIAYLIAGKILDRIIRP